MYSSNAAIRHRVAQALGRSPDIQLAPVDFVDTATQAVVMNQIASGSVDLAILDCEVTPVGGLGMAKQLKDELPQCPPIIVLTGRAQDAWLARWSGADAAVSQLVHPIELTSAVVRLLRRWLIG